MMKMKTKTNRVAVYYVKDNVYEYNIYFIKQILSYIDNLYIVVSEKCGDEELKLLKTFGTVIVFNASNSLAAYNYVLENQKNNIGKSKQIIFCDSYLFGPFVLLDKLFSAIDNCKADIYALETRMDNLVSGSFFVLKNIDNINSLSGISSSEYWIKANNLTIASFTHFTEEDNFYFLEIPENIIQQQQPFLQQGFFLQYPEQWLAHSGGMQIAKVLDYIKNKTDYNEKMILDWWVKKLPMSILRQNLHLNYILPDSFSYPHKSNASVALILYIYYEDLIDYCYKYALSMPENADIYIITCKDEMTKACKKAFAKFPCRKIYFRQMENRGRDVAAYLVAAKDVFYKYDYVCCMHDKKSPQYAKASGEDFAYHLFECNLSSKHYVANIIKIFDENPHLGMLVPPFVNFGATQTIQNQMATEADLVKTLLKKMEFSVPYDKDCVAPLGTMFWVRGKSFLPIFNHSWTHEDFPIEPNKANSTILHALERFYPFAIQEAGSYVGLSSPLRYSQVYLDTVYWFYKEELHTKHAQLFVEKYPSYCELININKIDNNYSVIYVRTDLNIDSLNLFANNQPLSKNYNLSANMQNLLKVEKHTAFFTIPNSFFKQKKLLLSALVKDEKIPFKYNSFILPDARLLKRDNIYVIPKKHKLLFSNDKIYFLRKCLFSTRTSFFDKICILLSLFRRKKYNLFAELPYSANDNAFAEMKYCVNYDKNSYYLIDKESVDKIKGINRSKVVIMHSWKHLWLLINAKRLIGAFSILFFFHNKLNAMHYSLLDYDMCYLWHGISADDKNSVIYKYLYGTPDICCAASDFERDFFIKKCEYPQNSVITTGYPRMDKWYDATLDDKQIMIFFTWRKNLISDQDLLSSEYYKQINFLLTFFSDKKWKNHKVIFCIYDYNYLRFKSIYDNLIKKYQSITFITNNIDVEKFNTLFKTSKYLITDYSSVAYDFAYKKESIPIYYLPNKAFINGHFNLTDNFEKRHLGVIVSDLPALEAALKMNAPTAEMRKRKNKFFKYQDNKNCERVYAAIFNNEGKQ